MSEDRSFHPGRRPPGSEAMDCRPEGDGGPIVVGADGIEHEVGDLNWLAMNRDYLSDLAVSRGAHRGKEALLAAKGRHPASGNFTFRVEWESSAVMKDWVDKYLPDTPVVNNQLRDGG